MALRTYYPGDEAAQVAIYNAAAAGLPGFKPTTLPEVQRRVRARDFDPKTRWYAEENGRLVGYIALSDRSRVSFPWCLPGHERWAERLFQEMLAALPHLGVRRIMAAYRADWPSVHAFFLSHGFRQAREMVNFGVDFFDLPTPPVRTGQALAPVERRDVPALFNLAPKLWRVGTPQALEEHLFGNPYFKPDALFATRSRVDQSLRAVGILINDPGYADPKAVDPAAPCFRLGAFGAEVVQTKRIKGLFSFVARFDRDLPGLGIDLLTQATLRLRDSDDISSLAAQVPSDVPDLLVFYQRYFRRQGSFPVFERDLT